MYLKTHLDYKIIINSQNNSKIDKELGFLKNLC